MKEITFYQCILQLMYAVIVCNIGSGLYVGTNRLDLLALGAK